MASNDKTHDAHGGHEGQHGTGRYWAIWGILLLFTLITVVTGRIDLGAANIFVAMLIATTKATLVVLFFMHLWDETAVNRLVFVSSVLFALVMILGVFGDLLTRHPSILPNGGPQPSKLHGGKLENLGQGQGTAPGGH